MNERMNKSYMYLFLVQTHEDMAIEENTNVSLSKPLDSEKKKKKRLFESQDIESTGKKVDI